MLFRLVVVLVALFILQKPVLSKSTLYKDPEIIVSDSLKGRVGEFLMVYKRAMKRLKVFASKYGYENLVVKPFIDTMEIYDTKSGYDNKLKKLYAEARKKPIPKTFVAGIENRTFFSVSPKVYAEVNPSEQSKDAFEKLVAHELAHRLHVRIVNGDEEKMGPIWFWEGFATFVSGQYREDKKKLSPSEIKAVVEKQERGSYRKYNKVFKLFLKNRSMKEYVKRASDKDFLAWLGIEKQGNNSP